MEEFCKKFGLNPTVCSKTPFLGSVRRELELALERVLLLGQPPRRPRELLREEVLQVALHLGPRSQPDLVGVREVLPGKLWTQIIINDY